jgi:glycosyltransferase involved in cell wall biosynthesis
MARRLRVAHIMPWDGVGGTEHAALRIARAVREEGFDTVFFCLGSAPVVRDFLQAAGFETGTWRSTYPEFDGYRTFLRDSIHLADEFRRHRIDLLHCGDVPAGKYAALAGRLVLAPVICHVRNRHAQICQPERQMLRAVTKFAFVSRSTWRQFGHAVPDDRGVVIYDGVERNPSGGGEDPRRDVRREFDVPRGTTLIGMVARVDQQKDYETLAKAARRLRDAGVQARFLIVGGYSVEPVQRKHFEQVKRWLAENGVADQFTFTDLRSDVPRLVQAMDTVVLSTHYEGLPLVLLEAMVLGKPVIATDVDGVPEVVSHGQTGLLFPHADDEMLAQHLIALTRDRSRAAELGRNAQSLVASRFNREQFKRGVVDLYETVLRRGPLSKALTPRLGRMPGLALTAGVTALDAGLAARRLVQKRSGLATIAKRSHE